MTFLRNHWFDIGIIICPFLIIYLIVTWEVNDIIKDILILNLIALFIHQFEEYRFPGNFPLMMNKVIFKSNEPDRYPLNSNSALIINVFIGWSGYFSAIIFSDNIILGIVLILVSFGNVIAHVVMFNIKGKTIYNPGMISSLVLFFPISILFVYYTVNQQLATFLDWVTGIVTGIIISFLSIFEVIDLLKDKSTKYKFTSLT